MALMEMMMPSYVAAASAVSFVNLGTLGSSGNAITLGQPASPQVNDVWIMLVQTSNQSITTPTNATAGTWAQIATQTGTGTAANAGAVRLGFFWHRWTTTTGNVTVADSGDHQIARIASYRGCRTTSNPWNAVSTMASGTSVAATYFYNAALTTTVDNCWVLHAVAHSEDIADAARISTSGSAAPITFNNPLRFDNSLATGTGGGIFLMDGICGTAASFDGTSQGLRTIMITNPLNYIKCAVALEPA